jgi:hypothetical protein
MDRLAIHVRVVGRRSDGHRERERRLTDGFLGVPGPADQSGTFRIMFFIRANTGTPEEIFPQITL